MARYSLDQALMRSGDTGQQLYIQLYRWIIAPTEAHATDLEELLLGAELSTWDRTVATHALSPCLSKERGEALLKLSPNLTGPAGRISPSAFDAAASVEFERGEPCAGLRAEAAYFDAIHHVGRAAADAVPPCDAKRSDVAERLFWD